MWWGCMWRNCTATNCRPSTRTRLPSGRPREWAPGSTPTATHEFAARSGAVGWSRGRVVRRRGRAIRLESGSEYRTAHHHRGGPGCGQCRGSRGDDPSVGRGCVLADRERSRQKRSQKDERIFTSGQGGAGRMMSQPDAGGHFGPYGGRYVPEVLMAPIEELETGVPRSARRSRRFRPSWRAAAHLRRPPDAALFRAAAQRKTRRRAASSSSAKTCCTPARTKSTTAWARRCWRAAWARQRIIAETGAGPARRRHGDRVRAVRLRMHRLHGRGGHAPPAAQRLPHATAGRESGAGTQRQPHAERRHQRSHARLGHQRRRHALSAGLGARARIRIR